MTLASLRVLQVLPELNTGGVERGTVDMAKAIVAAGGQAFVASHGGRLVPDLQRNGITHITLPLHSKSPWQIWRNSHRLAKIIRTHHINIVHARSRAPAWSALWASQRTKVPFVTTYHAAYSGHSWLKLAYNRVMTKGKRVIAISQYIEEHILSRYPEAAERLVRIERGIDINSFNPDHNRANRIAQFSSQWQIPDGLPVIMLPGRLSFRKGHIELLDVLKRLENLDWFCVFVGDGPAEKNIAEAIAAAKLTERVRLVGTCKDMPSAYMLADVVVHPSVWPEGFGRTVAEAQAMGRPVVASGAGAIPEIVLNGTTGWVVPPREQKLDTNLFAEHLRQALTLQPQERHTIAQHARERIIKNFSNEIMVHKTLQLYTELLNELR
jgi:glycosyltransferase involved in cell wall biosynthesis